MLLIIIYIDMYARIINMHFMATQYIAIYIHGTKYCVVSVAGYIVYIALDNCQTKTHSVIQLHRSLVVFTYYTSTFFIKNNNIMVYCVVTRAT